MDEKLKECVREALARGYCTERNSKKVLDPDLIEDMAIEVDKTITRLQEQPTEKLKKTITCLWKIMMDYHEDNPDRHLLPKSASQVAEETLIEIGENKR